MQHVEIGGGQVKADGQLVLPAFGPTSGYANAQAYANAQVDDYHGLRRAAYPHRAGVTLTLRARFSHGVGELIGTAGFGFWNAPFGDPTVPLPMLPSATWFFFASAPNRLPFLRGETGWFASTVDARWGRSLALVPLVVPVTMGNQFRPIFTKIWPPIERWLGISAEPIPTQFAMTEWHTYQLDWQPDSCRFFINDTLIHQTSTSPNRPLGFVCWLDNQYLVVTPQGRFRAGTIATPQEQTLYVQDIQFR